MYSSSLISDKPRNPASKNDDSGVNYFYHFRKDFLKPYGLAHDADSFNEESFSHRLNTINCEYVVRPQIAISEFSDAVLQNLEYIKENKDFRDRIVKRIY